MAKNPGVFLSAKSLGKQLWGQFSGLTPAVKAAAISVGVATLVAATVVVLQWGTAPSTMGSGPQSWIDAPLHGDVISLAPYSMVAHATSTEGVASFEFSVNGVVEATMDSQATVLAGDQSKGKYSGGYTLEWVGFEWTPPGPGTYNLEVRAVHFGNLWGPPALAQVTVTGAEPGTTTTTAPATTTTAVPRTTSTVTTISATTTTSTPSTTTQPADSAGPVFSRVSGTPGVFYQGTAACGPTGVTVTALVTDPSGIATVAVSYRVVIPGVTVGEFQAGQMSHIGGDGYQATIQSSDLAAIPIPPRGLPPTATLEFYAVAADIAGNETQSATDTSINMKVCSS